MTRKASVLVLVAIAGLTFSASAFAQTLSFSVADKLATRLAREQVRARHLLVYQLAGPRRVSSREIVFDYADRSRQHVFCKALIVVSGPSGRSNTVTARFTRQRCKGIPADALQVESVTLAAVHQVKAHRPLIERSLARFTRSLKPCARLRVPPAVRARAAIVLGVGALEALSGPIEPILQQFTGRLRGINTYERTLTAGSLAWGDYLGALLRLPRVPDACASVRAWARDAYAADRSPIDFKAFRALDRRARADERVLAAGSGTLANDGVLTAAVLGYTPKGLFLSLQPKLTIR